MKILNTFSQYAVLLSFALFISSKPVLADDNKLNTRSESTLSLSEAVQKVINNDFSLLTSSLESQSFKSEAESKDALPDPVFFAAMQNLPTDTFDLDQEAMTQFRFGVKQMFPKGDSIEISKQLVLHNKVLQDFIQQKTILTLKQKTQMAWLEAWYWQKYKAVIEHDRVFLTQMLDFMQSIYQIGGNNQSDLIGAELELIKLDEKVLDAERNYQTFRSELNTLANTVFTEEYLSSELISLPVLTIPANENLYASLAQHPDLLILKETSAQLADKIALVEQDKKAQWGIEVSYGLRQGENPNGSNRSDLLSAGLSVQVPLFSGKQKTHGVSAVRYQQDAIENRYVEELHKARFELENLRQQYENTLAQRMLFETQILPTLAKQKQSALLSYESDKGDFRTVTDLYIKEQATKVKHQRLRVNEQLILTKINYWLNFDSAIHEKYVRREFDQETF